MTVIRPAKRQDLPRLAELVRQEVEYQQKLARYFELIPRIDWAGYVSARLRHSDTEILVAEQNNNLVGFIEIRIVHPEQHSIRKQLKSMARKLLRREHQKGDQVGFIEDIYVVPVLRKQGIATALLQNSIRWFQSQQVTEIQAAIWAANNVSLNFFRKFGFEPIRLMMSKGV